MRPYPFALTLLLPLLIGCQEAPPLSDPPEPPPPISACDGTKDTESAPLQRLTRTQYNRTVLDLLGYSGDASASFPIDEDQLGFLTGLTPASRQHAEAYFTAAGDLATFALAHIRELSPCHELTLDCAEIFIASFGRRAFRRPLSRDEVDAYLRLLPSDITQPRSFAGGVQLIIQAMLQAPDFLYRVELGLSGEEGSLVELGQYELASRLSYFLWNSMPDDALLDAAEAGELRTTAQLEAQARRMLEDPRAERMAEDFVTQWLQLDRLDLTVKEPAVFPAFTPELQSAAREETVRFFQHVLTQGDGRLESLLSADFSFMNADLAELYGVSGVTGDELRMHALPDERAGLLTHASLLMINAHPNQTSPVHRGYFIRERFLCTTPAPPPDDVDATVAPPTPGLSTRERFAEHSVNPACNGCHQLMDPIGFGFEAYDGIGRHQEEDQGVPVDTSGEIVGTDIAGEFDGPIELSEQLAGSSTVQRCMVQQWFRFAHRRPAGVKDACSIESALEAFESSDFNIRELIIATVRTDSFRHYRRAATGG